MKKLSILLVRHAESIANDLGIMLGQKENECKHLSIKGIRQAEDAGYKISKTEPKIDAIYSSNLARAYETAVMIGYSCEEDLKVHRNTGLKEMNLGIAEEMAVKEFIKNYPKETDIWREYGYPIGIEGQEDPKQLGERMYKAIQKIAKKEVNNNTICIVSHQLAITCLLILLLNNSKTTLQIGNCEYVHLTYDYDTDKLEIGYND